MGYNAVNDPSQAFSAFLGLIAYVLANDWFFIAIALICVVIVLLYTKIFK